MDTIRVCVAVDSHQQLTGKKLMAAGTESFSRHMSVLAKMASFIHLQYIHHINFIPYVFCDKFLTS